MVNEDLDRFTKVAKKHSTGVIEDGKSQHRGLNASSYNNQSDTDKSVGATGRKI